MTLRAAIPLLCLLLGPVARAQRPPSLHLSLPPREQAIAIATAPDLDWFATLADAGTLGGKQLRHVQLWDATDGHFLKQQLVEDAVSLTILNKPALLLVGKQDGSIQVLDPATLRDLKAIQLVDANLPYSEYPSPRIVQGLWTAADGNVVAATSQHLYRLDATTFAITKLADFPFPESLFAATPDATEIAVASEDFPSLPNAKATHVAVYSSATGSPLLQRDFPPFVEALALSGGLLAVAARNSADVTVPAGRIQVVRLPDSGPFADFAVGDTPRTLRLLSLPAAQATPTEIVGGGGLLLGLRAYGLPRGQVLASGAQSEIYNVLSEVGGRLLAGARSPELCDSESLHCPTPPTGLGGPVTAVAELPDNRLLLLTSKGIALKLGDNTSTIGGNGLLGTSSILQNFNGSNGAFAFSALADEGKITDLLDPHSAVTQSAAIGGNPWLPADAQFQLAGYVAAISADGRWVATFAPGTSPDATIFDLTSVKKGSSPAAPENSVWRVTQDGESLMWGGVKPTYFAFTPDSKQLLAVNLSAGAIKRWSTESRREVLPAIRIPDSPARQATLLSNAVDAWAISADGSAVAMVQGRMLRALDLRTGANDPPATLGISDGATATQMIALPSGGYLIACSDGNLWKWDGSKPPALFASLGTENPIVAVALAVKHGLLLVSTADEAIHILDEPRGAERGLLFVFNNGTDWLIAAPNGRFDASDQHTWEGARWVFGDESFAPSVPVDAYVDQYLTPGLATAIMAGDAPPAPALQRKETASAAITIAADGPVQDGRVRLRVRASAPAGVAVRGLSLERNDHLIQSWPELPPDGNASVLADVVPGDNTFTAFAFNQDGVKSPVAELHIQGPDELRIGNLYLITIGVDAYRNPAFRLHFAVNDANLVADAMRAEQKPVGMLVTQVATAHSPISAIWMPGGGTLQLTQLIDKDATREGILAALRRVAAAAGPQDSVVVFYAGHGVAIGQQYYLVPQDFDFSGPPDQLVQNGAAVLQRGAISDRDIATALAGLQAGVSAFILDACESGAALGGAGGIRRSAANSAGLAQLAYDKGMYVLAAAQATQSAEERAGMQHGLLTYVLVKQGLLDGQAFDKRDATPLGDDPLSLDQWLHWAVESVPLVKTGDVPRALGVMVAQGQQPRLFAPGRNNDMIVGAHPIALDPATMTALGFSSSPGTAATVATPPIRLNSRPLPRLAFRPAYVGRTSSGVFLLGGKQIVLGGPDGLSEWDLELGVRLWRIPINELNVLSVDVSSDGDVIAMVSDGSVLRVQPGSLAATVVIPSAGAVVTNGYVHWIGAQILVIRDLSVQVFSPTGGPGPAVTLSAWLMSAAVISPDNKMLYVAMDGRVVSFTLPDLNPHLRFNFRNCNLRSSESSMFMRV